MNDFFKNFVTPYGMLTAVFLLVLSYAYALSRIMLALSHEATVVMAIAIAVGIFVAGFGFERATNLKQAHLAAIVVGVYLVIIGAATIAAYSIPADGHGHDDTAHGTNQVEQVEANQ